MREGEGARGGMGRELRLQPLLLRRSDTAAARRRAVRVQREHSPGPRAEGVVALAGLPRRPDQLAHAIEIVVVPESAGGLILVIPRHGMDDAPHASPRRVEARAVGGEESVLVLV